MGNRILFTWLLLICTFPKRKCSSVVLVSVYMDGCKKCRWMECCLCCWCVAAVESFPPFPSLPRLPLCCSPADGVRGGAQPLQPQAQEVAAADRRRDGKRSHGHLPHPPQWHYLSVGCLTFTHSAKPVALSEWALLPPEQFAPCAGIRSHWEISMCSLYRFHFQSLTALEAVKPFAKTFLQDLI